jgi:hypothetical protein
MLDSSAWPRNMPGVHAAVVDEDRVVIEFEFMFVLLGHVFWFFPTSSSGLFEPGGVGTSAIAASFEE